MLFLARLPFDDCREGELRWFSVCDRLLAFCDFWVSVDLFEACEAPTLLLSNKIGSSTEAAFEEERCDPLSLALSAPAAIPNPSIACKPDITKLPGVPALFISSGRGIILAVIVYISFRDRKSVV